MKAWIIASTEMRRFLRDRMAMFFTLFLPIGIILLVGSATAQFDDATMPVGLVGGQNGTIAREVARALESTDQLEVERFDDAEDVSKAVRRGTLAAGIVIPPDFDEKVAAGKPTNVTFLSDPGRGFGPATRVVVSRAIAEQGAYAQAASFASRRTGQPFAAALDQAKRTEELLTSTRIGVADESVGSKQQEAFLAPGFGYQTPSNLVLFVFITSLAGASGLIQSRRLGITRRTYGTPTTARQILAGVTLSRFLLAGFQATFLFVVGTLLFGVDWGDPLGAGLLIVLFVAVGASAGMVFGSILRTPEQANLGPPLGIAFGMLGGCMWPLEIVPPTMQTIGHLLPHAWAMDAWIELIGRGGSVADILPNLGVLAAFVAVLFPIGAWRLRRSIVAG